MKNKVTMSFLLAALVLGFGSYTFAFFDNGDVDMRKVPKEMQERHEQMAQILETKDYNAWKEMIDSKPRITDIITEDNFDKFVKMHELRMNGDNEGAKVVAEELGLNNFGPRGGFGHGKGMGRGFQKDIEQK